MTIADLSQIISAPKLEAKGREADVAQAARQAEAARKERKEAEPNEVDEAQNVSRAKAEEIASKVFGTDARLSIEKVSSGNFVYKFLDNKTGEVLRQYPPKGLLDFLEAQFELATEAEPAQEGVVVDKSA